jgi:hypothetical protein
VLCFAFVSRQVPPLWSAAGLRSRWEIYKLARPLEAGWRLATAPWRALPDIVVLGEVAGKRHPATLRAV